MSPLFLSVLLIVFLVFSFISFLKIIQNLARARFFRSLLASIFLFVSMCGTLVCGALISYLKVNEQELVATLSSSKLALQKYEVIFEVPDALPIHFETLGDMWQLDAHILVWPKYLQWLGFRSSYQLVRYSGRYLTIEDEYQKGRSLYSLGIPFLSDYSARFWEHVEQNGWLPNFSTKYGSSVFVPMTHGAKYDVYFHDYGLNVIPLNHEAKQASDRLL